MFLVEAEHPVVPGIVRELFHTREVAIVKASELADEIAQVLELKPRVALSSLEFVQVAIDEEVEARDDDTSAYVMILEIQPGDTYIKTDVLKRIVVNFGPQYVTHPAIVDAKAIVG